MSPAETGGRRRSDLPVRAATGAAMIAVAASALWVGGIWFWLLCVVGAIVMLGEMVSLRARRRALRDEAATDRVSADYREGTA